MLIRTCQRSDGTVQIWRIQPNGTATFTTIKKPISDKRREWLLKSEERRRKADQRIQFGRR